MFGVGACAALSSGRPTPSGSDQRPGGGYSVVAVDLSVGWDVLRCCAEWWVSVSIWWRVTNFSLGIRIALAIRCEGRGVGFAVVRVPSCGYSLVVSGDCPREAPGSTVRNAVEDEPGEAWEGKDLGGLGDVDGCRDPDDLDMR